MSEYDMLLPENLEILKSYFKDDYKEHKKDNLKKHLFEKFIKDFDDSQDSSQIEKNSRIIEQVSTFIANSDIDITDEQLSQLLNHSIKNDLEIIKKVYNDNLEKATTQSFLSHYVHSLEQYARNKIAKNFIVNLCPKSMWRELNKKDFPSLKKNDGSENDVCTAKYIKENRFEIFYEPEAEESIIRAGIGHELGHLMCIIVDGNDNLHSHDEIFCSFLSIWILLKRTDFYKNKCGQYILSLDEIISSVHFFHETHKDNYKDHTINRNSHYK